MFNSLKQDVVTDPKPKKKTKLKNMCKQYVMFHFRMKFVIQSLSTFGNF